MLPDKGRKFNLKKVIWNLISISELLFSFSIKRNDAITILKNTFPRLKNIIGREKTNKKVTFLEIF